MFRYENGLVFAIHLSDQKFEDLMDFLLLINNDKLHNEYIKDYLFFTKQKIKTKNIFAKAVYHALVIKMY